MGSLWVLLVALASMCQGFQPGLEYSFQYNGRLLTRVSGERAFSAVGLSAALTVQATHQRFLILQLTNVETAANHGEEDPCNDPLQNQNPLASDDLLQRPFAVYLRNRDNASEWQIKLQTTEEPVWVTNVRRSILSLIMAQPLLQSLEGRQVGVTPFFYHDEPSIAGTCRTDYTLAKVPVHVSLYEDQQQEAVMGEDVQRHRWQQRPQHPGGTKTGFKTVPAGLSPPPLHDQLWTMTRARDYGTCKPPRIHEMHWTEREAIKQTSVGQYLLRGKPGALRLERAVVKGAVSLLADQHSQYPLTLTNQTLQLRQVRMLKHELRLPVASVFSDTLSFRAHSHAQDLTESSLTGEFPSEHQETDVQGIAVKLVVKLGRGPKERECEDGSETVAEEFGRLVAALSTLTQPQIHNVSKRLDANNSRHATTLHQALTTAGTDAAVGFILQRLRDLDYLTTYPHHFTYFLHGAATSLKSPNLVPTIMELVMSRNWSYGEDLMYRTEFRVAAIAPAALMSFAALAHDLCLAPERRRAEGECLHRLSTCDPQPILNTFLPHLVAAVENVNEREWRRMVYLQSLCNLGTPHTLPALLPLAVGSANASTQLRLLSISCLSTKHLGETTGLTAYSTLMTIFRDEAEDDEVRQVAFTSLLTYDTVPGWLETLALATWTLPRDLANFVSATLTTIADAPHHPLSGRARLVAPMARPHVHTSASSSAMLYFDMFLHNCKASWHAGLTWLTAPTDILPTRFALSLYHNAFLGVLKELSLDVTLDEFDWQSMLRYLLPITIKRRSDYPAAMDSYQRVKEELNLDPESLFTWYWKHRSIYITALNKLLIKVLGFIQISDPWVTLGLNFEMYELMATHHHHLRLEDAAVAVPTDLGLPLIVQYTTDLSFSFNRFIIRDRQPVVGSDAFTISRHVKVEARALVPWSGGLSVGVGVANTASLHLPFRLTHSYRGTRNPYAYDRLPTLSLVLRLHRQNCSKKSVAEWFNRAYVVAGGWFSSASHPPTAYPVQPAHTLNHYPEMEQLQAMGLSLRPTWRTAPGLPATFSAFLSEEERPFAPSPHYWHYRLELDLENSSTHEISLGLFVMMPFEMEQTIMESLVVENETEDLDEAAGGQDYSRVSDDEGHSQPDGFVSPKPSSTFPSDFDAYTRAYDHLHTIQGQLVPVEGGTVYALGTLMELRNGQGVTRRTEAPLILVTGKGLTGVHLQLYRQTPGRSLHDLEATCVRLEFRHPDLPFADIPSDEEVLTADLSTTANLRLYRAADCLYRDRPHFEAQGTLSLSEKRRQAFREELYRDCGAGACGGGWRTGDVAHQSQQCQPRGPTHDTPALTATSLFYDLFLLEANWTKAGHVFATSVLPMLRAESRGMDEHSNTRDDDHLMLRATRGETWRSAWDVRMSSMRVSTEVGPVTLPEWLASLLVPAPLVTSLQHNILLGRVDRTCVISQQQVRTFDGNLYSLEPTQCWTTAVISSYIDSNTTVTDTALLVQVRFTDKWEVQVIYPYVSLLIEISDGHLLVNGEEMQGADPESRFSYLVRENGALVLTIPNIISLKVAANIQIHVDYLLIGRNMTRGLCGDHDGEPTNDIAGPAGCLYVGREELLRDAWSTPGHGCSGSSFRARKRAVDRYRQNCPTVTRRPVAQTFPNAFRVCEFWEQREQEAEGDRYQAVQLTPKCLDGCVPITTDHKEMEYQQWDRREDQVCSVRHLNTVITPSCVPQPSPPAQFSP